MMDSKQKEKEIFLRKQKETVLRRISNYRETKANNIFDDFFRSDLDFMEECIEIAESHGYQKKLDNPSDPGEAEPMSAEEFLERVRDLKDRSVETLIQQNPSSIADVDTEVILFLTSNRYRILDNLDDAYTDYFKR